MDIDLHIYKTKDLSLFKKTQKNRDIKPNVVSSLVNSIKENNYLYARPILVNRKYEVLDGQHRLAAAKVLGIEIYYQFVESDEAIRVLNATQVCWNRNDFLNFFKDNEHYKKFTQFMEEYKFNPTQAFTLLGGELTGSSKKGVEFRKGNFIYPEDDTNIRYMADIYKRMLEELRSCNLRILGTYLSRSFVGAIVTFFTSPLISQDRFFKALPSAIHLFQPSGLRKTYVQMFLDIYNYRAKNKISLDEVMQVR